MQRHLSQLNHRSSDPIGSDGGWSERQDMAAEASETLQVLCLDTQGAWRGKGIWSWLPESEGGESESPKGSVGWTGTRRIWQTQWVPDRSSSQEEVIAELTPGGTGFWNTSKTCLECSRTQARPNLLLQNVHDFGTGKVGIDKAWEPPVLILQSAWSCSQHGMPGWRDDLCKLL